MLTKEQVQISEKVQDEKNTSPALGELYLDFLLDDESYLNSDLHFVVLKLKKFKNLVLMLDILEEKNEFIINCVYLYMVLLKEYQGNGIDEYIALELVQRDVVELFEFYDQIKIETTSKVNY